MLFSTLFKTVVLMVTATILGTAAPTSPDTAARSFTSAGVTCYYVCPSTVTLSTGATLTLISGANVLGVGVCYYSLSLVTYTCNYVASTGQGVPNANIVCPTAITNVQCGSTQPSNSWKKRSEIDEAGKVIKKRSHKQQLIADRQFSYKRKTVSANKAATLKRGSLH